MRWNKELEIIFSTIQINRAVCFAVIYFILKYNGLRIALENKINKYGVLIRLGEYYYECKRKEAMDYKLY